MLTRRAVLMTGGASVLVLGAGCASIGASHGIAAAREPWQQAAKGFGDARLNAAAYAILAPSPHNLQPWMIHLEGSDDLTLFCDLSRRLPETDPPDRQTTIGLGAFLELLRQAAAEQGYQASVTPFPEGEPEARLDDRPIAHVRFTADEAVRRDPLFGTILQRHTARQKFDTDRPVPDETLRDMSDIAFGQNAMTGFRSGTATGATETRWLKDICKRAWEIELRKPETRRESAYLTRIGAKQINANPDGIFLKGPMMETLHMAGLLTQANMDKVGTTAWKATKSFYDGLIDSAPTFFWFASNGNTRTDQLASGAAWVRLHLAAAQAGVGFQPLSQVLEEYDEMAGPFAEIHEHFGVAPPSRIQGLFRLGYAHAEAPAPRWPLESRLIT